MLKDLQKTQSSIRARHRCPVAQVRVFAHAVDLSGASAGDLFAFSLFGLCGLQGFLGGDRFFRHGWQHGFFRRFHCFFALGRGHGWRGFGARHGDHVGALHADLLQVFFIGLGVVAQVFAGFTVNRDDQVVGLFEARDDFYQALAALGVVDGLGLAVGDQFGKRVLVALLRSLGVRSAAIDVGGAFVDVGGVGRDALVVIGDLLLALGVVCLLYTSPSPRDRG